MASILRQFLKKFQKFVFFTFFTKVDLVDLSREFLTHFCQNEILDHFGQNLRYQVGDLKVL